MAPWENERSITPGTFSWTDLTTTDQEAAKTFYSALFDWEITDVPVDETTSYSMAALGGTPVAAISPQPPQQRDNGAPPLWNSYITVRTPMPPSSGRKSSGPPSTLPPST